MTKLTWTRRPTGLFADVPGAPDCLAVIYSDASCWRWHVVMGDASSAAAGQSDSEETAKLEAEAALLRVVEAASDLALRRTLAVRQALGKGPLKEELI